MVILRVIYLKNMNIRPAILTFIIFACSFFKVIGQCDLTILATIEDVSSGSVDIFVEGASNNDLSNPNQGLCGVELFFEHTSIQDISISLQSPAGQQVTLVGPATGAGGNTQFTYWGVEFVPCDSIAAPDLPILDDVFTTEDNWGIFGNFSGEFYPQQGCLEDFDMGAVNGLWTLSFEDVQNFDVGSIDSIGLIFCDDTDLSCQECLANGGMLSGASADYCESDPDLNLDLEPIFDISEPNEDYVYNYLIVQDDEVIQTASEPDLSNYAFGNYQVCGLSFLQTQEEDILDDVIGTEFDNLISLFSDNSYCANVSSNCISINIIEVPDTILTIDTICTGDAIILDGAAYNETGEYVISFSEAFCDSVSILQLVVIDNQAVIDADSDVISCSDGDVLLDASNSITSSSTIRSWFRVDGFIDPSITSDMAITVSEAGVYGLSLITGICADTVYYEIENDDSIPSFTFDVDTLNCYNPSIEINMTPSIPLQSISWTGLLISDEEDIEVSLSGTYYLEGVATNGCIGKDSIFIEEDYEVPIPLLIGDTITCIKDTVSISVNLPDSLLYDFDWNGPNIIGGLASGDFIEVIQDTTYVLNLQNLSNGCIESFEYDVQIDTNRTNFIIQSTTIDCNFSESQITVNPSISTADYVWQFDNQVVGTTDTIVVDQIGSYKLEVTPENGCIDSFFHVVVQDTISPEISIDNVTISCLIDSIELIPSTSELGLTYFWTGPADYQSTDANPFVSNPGAYNLEATLPNGCSTNLDVSVYPGEGLPNITFTLSDTLDCNVERVTITPSDTTNLRFAWQSSNLISDTTAYIVEVERIGIYPLIVTDTISGCNLIYDVLAVGDVALPIPEIEFVNLDCNNSEVTLNTSFMVNVDSLKWTSDFGFNSTDQSPEITQSGNYYITAVGFNGCVFMDTITIVEENQLPTIITNVPLLDCLDSEVEISFSTIEETDTLRLRLPNGELIDQNSYLVTEPDSYVAIASSITGCIDSIVIDVLQDTSAIEASLITNGQINCTQNTSWIAVDYIPENGLSFAWTGNSIISPLDLDSIILDAEGIYSVVITDTSNCTRELEVNIESFIDFPLVESSVDTINCTQDLANIVLTIPNNIVSIIWDGPSEVDPDLTVFSVDVPGEYTAIVTANNNCITEEIITVEIDTILPVVNVFTDGILTCNLPNVTLTGNSDITGSVFAWTGPNSSMFDTESVEVNQAGTYDLSVLAPNTCSVDTFIVVEVDTLSPTIITGEDPVFSCSDGKVFLSIETTTNIISYSWEGPFGFESDIMEPLAIAPGAYTVTVTNDIGCASTAEITVIDDTNGPEIMTRDTFVTCDMLAVSLPLDTEDTEISYAWDAPGFSSILQNPETNQLGQYIVYAVSDRNECVTVDTVNVTFQVVPPVYQVESNDLNCYQSETTLNVLNAGDDLSVSWTDTEFNLIAMDSLPVSNADSFYVIVVGTNLCADTTQVTVGENVELDELEILLNEPFQCENLDVTLEGNVVAFDNMEDFLPTWSTSDGSILSHINNFDVNISGEGTYFLSVLNLINGCESMDTIVMIEEEQSLIGISVEGQVPNCLGFEDGSLLVSNVDGGFPPFQYVMDGQVAQTSPMFSNLGSDEYILTVIDSVGCKVEMEYRLEEGFDFMAFAESDTLIVVGDEIELFSSFNLPLEEVFSTSWTSNREDYNCDDCFEAPVNPLFNTLYTLTATTVDGCVDTSQVLVRVNRNPKIDVANVFAPSSTENGLFLIQQTSGIEKVLSISIFDKWASRMFIAENVNPGDPAGAWDGTYLGRDVNPGVYVVVAELLLYSGEVVTYAGDITLLR